jgi:CMP-N-acetylneuraminic acid synthetase
MLNHREKPIVIIPARGGSKRIPRKNIVEIIGKPALGILIERLKDFGLFQEIIVSTDDQDIAQVARNFGARVIQRSNAELSNDLVASEEVIRDGIRILDLEQSHVPIFCIYPLAILIKKAYLVEALDKLESNPDQFVIAGGELNPNPLRHTFVCEEKSLKIIFPENNYKRSQDLEKVYADIGMFYLAYPGIWSSEEKYWYHNNASMVPVGQEDSLDIDTVEDLNKLRYLAEKNLKQT